MLLQKTINKAKCKQWKIILILLLSKQTHASENQRQKVKASNHKLSL